MHGPKPHGFWSKNFREARKPLELDAVYRVARPFSDFDSVAHPVGESWRFVGSNYSAYDDGLSLFVQTDDGEWHIRLQIYPDQQEKLWNEFDQYIERVKQEPQ